MAPTTSWDASVRTWNASSQFGLIKYRGLYILVVNLFPSILAFCSPLKNFKLLEQFGDWWHIIKTMFFIKHLSNYSHSKLESLRDNGDGMFTHASTFLGSITFPSLDTMKLKMVPKNAINAHLSKFRLILNFLHWIKHFLSFSRWVDRLLKTIKSSRNIFMNSSMYSWNVLVIAL